MHQSQPIADDVRSRIEALRASRGYVLPHHGLLATAAPDLHDAYLEMYRALTLTDRHLTPFEKEFVWLAILSALREPAGTHHVNAFRHAGGTDGQATLAFQLAGYAAAADSFAFVESRWNGFFAADPLAMSYLAGADALRSSHVPPALAMLTLLAVQAARRSDWGIRVHLLAAYQSDISEDKIAEALGLVIWPAGVNRFVDACAIWQGLIMSGAVSPSPRYKAWAEIQGQGAFLPPREVT